MSQKTKFVGIIPYSFLQELKVPLHILHDIHLLSLFGDEISKLLVSKSRQQRQI
jgi:hypothetical protein